MKANAIKITSAFPMSPLIIVVTGIANALFVSMVVSAFRSSILALEILSLVILISPSLFIPLRLIVDGKSLRIWRPLGKVEIPLEDIKSCSIIEDSRSFFDKTIRTFGSGGMYGCLGHFRHDKYGKMRMFVTHIKQCFIIQMKDGHIFVVSSPKQKEIVEYISLGIK